MPQPKYQPLSDELGDELRQVLKKHGIPEAQMQTMLSSIQAGNEGGVGEALQQESAQQIAADEQTRLARISYYTDVSKRAAAGQPLTSEEKQYLAQVHARQDQLLQQRAAKLGSDSKMTALADRAMGGIQSIAGPYGNMPAQYKLGAPPVRDVRQLPITADTMDPFLREGQRLQNMTGYANEIANSAYPQGWQNWQFDGFNMVPAPSDAGDGAPAQPPPVAMNGGR
jgi:hypothetical protein